MSVASRIQSIEEHIEDVYDTLELGGLGTTSIDKNLVNISPNLKQKYIDYMNNGTEEIWNNWDKVQGSGTEITLNGTEEAPMKLELKGNTSQDTYTGKNLVDTQEQTITGLTIVKQDDGSLLVNGTISEIKFAQIVYMPDYTLSSGTYTLSCFDNTGQNYAGDFYIGSQYVYKNATNDKTLTIEAGTYNVRLQLYLPAKTYTDVKIYIQLENGSSKTSYEKYVGGKASPNPDYPQEVKVVKGDNVLKVSGNIYDYTDLAQTYAFLTYDGDGWYTATINNTSSSGVYYNFTTKKSNLLETDTTYSIVTEVKSITTTGNGGVINSWDRWGQFSVGISSGYTAVGTYVGTSTTKSDFENLTQMLASNIYVRANSSITTTFRFSVLKGTGITASNFKYAPYQAEEHKISLGVENLIDSKITSQTLNGVQFSVNEDKSIYISGTATARTEPKLWTNASGTLTLKANVTYYNNSNTTLYLYDGSYRTIVEGGSYTPTEDKSVTQIYIRVENGETIDKTIYPMLSTKQSSTYYQYGKNIELCKINTYQDKIIETDGKNKMPLFNGSSTLNGLTITIENNVVTINGTSTNGATFKLSNGIVGLSGASINDSWLNELIIKNKKNYTISVKYLSGTGATSGCAFRLYSNTSTYLNQFYPLTQDQSLTYPDDGGISLITFFTNPGYTFNNYKFAIQLEEGSSVTEFVPYGSGEYYKKEMVGIKVLDGTENTWNIGQNGQNLNYYYIAIADKPFGYGNILSNKFVSFGSSLWNISTYQDLMSGASANSTINFLLSDSSIDTKAKFLTWLANNNIKVYYGKLTTEYIKITNNTLIKQLDAIKKSKNSQTNISQENDGLSFELDVSALKSI